jgi:predicted RNA-binding Zn ribbon-like protein
MWLQIKFSCSNKMRKPHPKYSDFRFDAGSLSLNFVATVRHRGSLPRDLLASPDALAKWFGSAGCSSSAAEISDQDLQGALLLREAIYRVLSALVEKKRPASIDMKLINSAAAESLAVPQIEFPTCRVRWESARPAKACLAEVARDAVMVIGGSDRQRLKMCDSSSCRMLFADNSPANRRRWCAMSICGNRAKIKEFREKKRPPENGPKNAQD